MYPNAFGYFKAYAFYNFARIFMVSYYSFLNLGSVRLLIAQLKLKGKKKSHLLRLKLFLRIYFSKITLKIPREHGVAEYRFISCFNI